MHRPSGLKNWARLHVFRTFSAVLTLLLLGLCFFYSPEVITAWLRLTVRMIELVSGVLPYPWGDRVEIALKALGGSFWFQITTAIILVRIVLSSIAAGWRRRRRPLAVAGGTLAGAPPAPAAKQASAGGDRNRCG